MKCQKDCVLTVLWSSLRTEHPKIISVCSLQAVGCREHWLWSLRPDCEFHFHHNYQWDHRQAVLSPTASVFSSKKRRESWVAEREKLEKNKRRKHFEIFFLNLKILRNRMYYLMIVRVETCAFSYFLTLNFLFSSICLIGIVDVCLISGNCQLLMLWLKSIAKLTKSKEQVQRDLQNKWFIRMNF